MNSVICLFMCNSLDMVILVNYCYLAVMKQHKCYSTVLQVYHPTSNDNFSNNCPITVIFGTVLTE